jgi:hypothetical protein
VLQIYAPIHDSNAFSPESRGVFRDAAEGERGCQPPVGKHDAVTGDSFRIGIVMEEISDKARACDVCAPRNIAIR